MPTASIVPESDESVPEPVIAAKHGEEEARFPTLCVSPESVSDNIGHLDQIAHMAWNEERMPGDSAKSTPDAAHLLKSRHERSEAGHNGLVGVVRHDSWKANASKKCFVPSKDLLEGRLVGCKCGSYGLVGDLAEQCHVTPRSGEIQEVESYPLTFKKRQVNVGRRHTVKALDIFSALRVCGPDGGQIGGPKSAHLVISLVARKARKARDLCLLWIRPEHPGDMDLGTRKAISRSDRLDLVRLSIPSVGRDSDPGKGIVRCLARMPRRDTRFVHVQDVDAHECAPADMLGRLPQVDLASRKQARWTNGKGRYGPRQSRTLDPGHGPLRHQREHRMSVVPVVVQSTMPCTVIFGALPSRIARDLLSMVR